MPDPFFLEAMPLPEDIFKIAIAEDDPTIRALLEMAFAGDGYREVESYARGDEALAGIRKTRPDLVILDIMLPGLDGYEICRRIRDSESLSGTRIIMLTARTQSEDIVRGLDAGADDYVTKPFDRRILLARARAVLRRGAETGGREFDGLSLDPESRSAMLHGEELELSPGEFRLLAKLVAHRGRVMARDAADRTVDVQIANLRRKLGEWSAHIETIRGVGYRIRP